MAACFYNKYSIFYIKWLILSIFSKNGIFIFQILFAVTFLTLYCHRLYRRCILSCAKFDLYNVPRCDKPIDFSIRFSAVCIVA